MPTLELKNINTGREVIKKRKRKKNMQRDAIQAIYELCEPHIEKGERFIQASDIEEMTGGCYSGPILMKARRALGIKSVRMRGHFYWTMPRRSLANAMAYLNDHNLNPLEKEVYKVDENERKANRTSVAMIKDMMEGAGYCCLANDILRECQYSRVTAKRAKAIIGIRSFKSKEGWHWAWGAQPVQDWLQETLSHSPVVREDLLKIAADKGWNELVVRAACLDLGGIKTKWRNRKIYLYDINSDNQEVA